MVNDLPLKLPKKYHNIRENYSDSAILEKSTFKVLPFEALNPVIFPSLSRMKFITLTAWVPLKESGLYASKTIKFLLFIRLYPEKQVTIFWTILLNDFRNFHLRKMITYNKGDLAVPLDTEQSAFK